MKTISDYTSFKYYTTHFDIKAIVERINIHFDSNLSQNSIFENLTSTQIQPLIRELENKNYYFDKLLNEVSRTDKIDYLYIVSTDSNKNFIDSYDNQNVSSSSTLYQSFQNDTNNHENFLNDIYNNSYTLFHNNNNENYIIVKIPFNNFQIYIFVETFRDNSSLPDLDFQGGTQLHYGFEILTEDEMVINHVQNPYDRPFEYAT